jgi:hypothetical protein
MDIKIKVGLGLLFAATAVAPAIATAGPPGGVVQPHQHYVQSEGNGLVPVGPNACQDGPSKQFDNFHLNGHVGEPGARGVIVGRGCPTP